MFVLFDFVSNLSPIERHIIIILLSLLLIFILVFLLYEILKTPYHYPYFVHEFDVSGKRKVNIENYIDNFLRNPQNWHTLKMHNQIIAEWKKETAHHANHAVLKKYRTKQQQRALDDAHAYHFITVRSQTRYTQKNYIRTPYTVMQTDNEWTVNWNYLQKRYSKLKAIGFESTINEYEQKNQRALMTPALRNKIKQRDNFTCQFCGKYMPDEVGLHIDHIIPIAQGGKSVESNLQVLCSKCNGRKGSN